MAATVRIARVTATGARYIVNRLEIAGGKISRVHVWGEVCSVDARLNAKHETQKTFLGEAVTIENDVPRTYALLAGLFEQCCKAHADKGDSVHRTRAGNAVITPARR